MAKKKTNTITINDVEYAEDKLTSDQINLVNHVSDLERKIASTQFNLNQLQVGRNAFLHMLTMSLDFETKETTVEE